MSKIILALVGLPGSGKTEATEYLMKKTGWPKVYFGDVTFDEMKRINLSINEVNERETRERIRKELGMGAYAILSIPKIKEFLKVILPGNLIDQTLLRQELKDNFRKYHLAVRDSLPQQLKMV